MSLRNDFIFVFIQYHIGAMLSKTVLPKSEGFKKKIKMRDGHIESGIQTLCTLWFVMTFLTVLGITEILCSFRLVLQGKTSKEIPDTSRLEFLGQKK